MSREGWVALLRLPERTSEHWACLEQGHGEFRDIPRPVHHSKGQSIEELGSGDFHLRRAWGRGCGGGRDGKKQLKHGLFQSGICYGIGSENMGLKPEGSCNHRSQQALLNFHTWFWGSGISKAN